MKPINLRDAFARIEEPWQPRIAAEVDDMHVKLARLRGEFVWHQHEMEDELFLVVSGRLQMRFRDRDVWLAPGEMLVVPRGVEHCPVAPDDCEVVLFERKGTVNTGAERNERTVLEPRRIDVDG